jgi:hypothetical protein
MKGAMKESREAETSPGQGSNEGMDCAVGVAAASAADIGSKMRQGLAQAWHRQVYSS